MPGGRPKDEYRDRLAKAAGIPREKTRRLSLWQLEHLARLPETERKLIAPSIGRKVGRSPRYRSSLPKQQKRNPTKAFQSRVLAQMVAHSLQTMTGEQCDVEEEKMGKFIVLRYCYGGKVVQV